MKALVNGMEWELADGTTVQEVVRRLATGSTGIAVARGGELVPCAAWLTTPVLDGDAIEVITAVQGG